MSRKRLSRTLERRIITRDNETCVICREITPFDKGHIDHNIPLSRGGTDDFSNLQWTCGRCNTLKGNNKTNDEVRIQLGLPPHTFLVKWFLSGTVMPIPRYGKGDILDSDVKSSIVINQLGKDGKVSIICDFNGLRPNARHRLSIGKTYSRHTAWPGLFSSKVPPISFVTDSEGRATREFTLTIDDFSTSGTRSMSVWLNELDPNRTILISDIFSVII